MEQERLFGLVLLSVHREFKISEDNFITKRF